MTSTTYWSPSSSAILVGVTVADGSRAVDVYADWRSIAFAGHLSGPLSLALSSCFGVCHNPTLSRMPTPVVGMRRDRSRSSHCRAGSPGSDVSPYVDYPLFRLSYSYNNTESSPCTPFFSVTFCHMYLRGLCDIIDL